MGVFVRVGLGEGVFVGVFEAVGAGGLVAVAGGYGREVSVGSGVGALVAVAVEVGVAVAEAVIVPVGVLVDVGPGTDAVIDGEALAVCVDVAVMVGVTWAVPSAARSCATRTITIPAI